MTRLVTSPKVCAKSRSAPNQRIEARISGAAHRNFGAVRQDGQPGVLRVRLNARDSVEIHQKATMDPDEAPGMQRAFEARNRLLLEPCAAFAAQGYIVILRLGIIQLAGGNDVHFRAVPHHDALQVLTRWTRGVPEFGGRQWGLRAALQLLQRRSETIASERLQQVIDGGGVEGPHRILIEGGREDNRRSPFDQLEHFEAVELWHLHVEKYNVRLMLRDRFHRLEAVGALRDDVNAGFLFEILAQDAARQFFIVDDYCLHAFLIGIATLTR